MVKKQRGRPKPTAKQLILYLLFQSLQIVSTRLASLMAYHLWFHPSRQGLRHLPEFTPPGMRAEQVRVNNKRVFYWVAEPVSGLVNKPLESVFLMHGWASCGKQMATMGRGFLDAGYRIIWMDAPAHCASQGYQTSLFEISESIVQVQQKEGAFEAIVAHSFGVPCSLYAIARQSLEVEKIVSISAPATTEKLMQTYCRMIRANAATEAALMQRFKKFLGHIDISETSALTNAALIKQPCLVIHDKHDRMTPAEGSQRLSEAFAEARFIQTERLGHNKILKDAAVVKVCVEFVQQGEVIDMSIKQTG